jgi:acyl carrier protein
MWQAGANLRFSPLWGDGEFRRLPLPGYRFRTQRYGEPPYAMPEATVSTAGLAGARGADISGETIIAEVMAAWEDVLGETPNSADADFYDAGGDSLAASELVVAIEVRFGVSMEPDVLFSDPSPRQLATRIRDLLAGHASPDAQRS